MATTRARRWLVRAMVLVAAGALAAACSGSGQSAGPTFVAAGQIPRADLPTGGPNGAAGAISANNTVPLAKQDPTTALFSAIGLFESCLTGMGVTYIGIPGPSNSNPAAADPTYLKSLSTCAVNSNILQALKTAQTAQDNLTPAQVKVQNKQYLKWRTCMIARGWGIPEPKPNEKGLLFSFGTSATDAADAATQFKPPAGQSILSSSDLEACAEKAQAESS